MAGRRRLERRTAAGGPDPYGPTPEERRKGAAALAAARPGRRRHDEVAPIGAWPSRSPGAANAWLVLLASKPPTGEDPLLPWPEEPLTFGEAHLGFFYPDTLGYLAEVRRWITELVRAAEPGAHTADALAVSALAHVGDDPTVAAAVLAICSPAVVLCLDDGAWRLAGLTPVRVESHHVPDPHRAGQVYQGLWGRTAEGTVVGKAPQHPAAHHFYRAVDLTDFLCAAPITPR